MLVTAALALTALLPVTSLSGRLGLPAWRGGDLGMEWSTLAWSPTVTRSVGLAMLVRLLLSVGAGVVAVAALTTLSLMIARASTRSIEVSVRRAVGASRGQLIAAALLENGIVAAAAILLGGVGGSALALPVTSAWPGSLRSFQLATTGVAAVCIVASILLGALVPLVFPRRTTPLPLVPGKPLELVVPALQLGLGLTILTAAALLERQAGPLVVAQHRGALRGEVLQLTASEPRPDKRADQYAAVLRELRSRRHKEPVSLSSPGTLVGVGMVDIVITDCGACQQGGLPFPLQPVLATHHFVSADTFGLLGLAVLQGRGIASGDRWNTPRVAIVNHSLAARHFQQGAAVGRKIAIGRARAEWYTVVGIVEDQHAIGVGGGLQPPFAVYLPVLQHPVPAVDLVLRGSLDDVRTSGLDRRAPPVSVARLVDAEVAPLRWFARLFGVEGWVILALATVGTGAVMQLWVRSLWYELGVRRAAGARRRDILSFVLLRATGVAAGGVAIGLWVGLVVWGTLSTIVAGLPEWDTSTALRFAPLLAGAAIASTLPSAWQAAAARPTRLLDAAD